MQLTIRQKFNRFRDSILYPSFSINKLSPLLEKNSTNNCGIICPGKSLNIFNSKSLNVDFLILVNFNYDSFFDQIYLKIKSTPVIIFSNIEEKILNKKNRKKLNVKYVFIRFTEKDWQKKRIRKRLEAYRVPVNSLLGIVNKFKADTELQNTGLLSIYFASLFFQSITIFGMDFFDNSYINERQVDDLKIYSKRKISKEEFSASLFKKFLNICVEFPHVNYVMYTSYRNVTNVSLPNLSIIRMPK